MSYHPGVGRFLERDPIGFDESLVGDRPGAVSASPPQSAESPDVVAWAVENARTAASERFGVEHSDDWWLWRYTDGSNLYQFVGSNPMHDTDPSGMDRYMINGGGGHHAIAVDVWAMQKNGKWAKTGVMRYDYAADYRWNIFLIGAIIAGCPGRVTPSPGLSGQVVATLPSTPEADNALKMALDIAVVDPPIYHVGFNNCNNFAQDNLLVGIPLDYWGNPIKTPPSKIPRQTEPAFPAPTSPPTTQPSR